MCDKINDGIARLDDTDLPLLTQNEPKNKQNQLKDYESNNLSSTNYYEGEWINDDCEAFPSSENYASQMLSVAAIVRTDFAIIH